VFTLTHPNPTEAEALADVLARGWEGLTVTAPAEDAEWHWHDFDSVITILEGEVRVEFGDGSAAMDLKAGARIEAPREVVHREITQGYRRSSVSAFRLPNSLSR
jgi:hypothetical protein